MSDVVCAELAYARLCIQREMYFDALVAIKRAEKAWAVEVDAWAIELAAAEKEINGRRNPPPKRPSAVPNPCPPRWL